MGQHRSLPSRPNLSPPTALTIQQRVHRMSDPQYPSYAQLCEFVQYAGRLPRLSDPIPAHRYAGWALPMIMEGHRILPDVPDRWGYHLRILQAQHLPDEPIPQIHFLSGPHPDALKHLHQWIRLAAHHQSTWTGMTNFIEWLAYALQVSQTPPRLDDAIQVELYQHVNLLEMVQHPYDYFGDIISEGLGNGPWANPNNFYPTPMEICRLMAAMTLPDITKVSLQKVKNLRTAKIADPAGSGTGRMLLLASNISLSLYGCEKDPLVRTVSLINGALYAPWLAFPIPDHILESDLPTDAATSDNATCTQALLAPGHLQAITSLNQPPCIATTLDEIDEHTMQLVLPGW